MTAEGKASNSLRLLWKSWLVSKPCHCHNSLAGTTPHSWLCSSREAAEHTGFPQDQVASVWGKILARLFFFFFRTISYKFFKDQKN